MLLPISCMPRPSRSWGRAPCIHGGALSVCAFHVNRPCYCGQFCACPLLAGPPLPDPAALRPSAGGPLALPSAGAPGAGPSLAEKKAAAYAAAVQQLNAARDGRQEVRAAALFKDAFQSASGDERLGRSVDMLRIWQLAQVSLMWARTSGGRRASFCFPKLVLAGKACNRFLPSILLGLEGQDMSCLRCPMSL